MMTRLLPWICLLLLLPASCRRPDESKPRGDDAAQAGPQSTKPGRPAREQQPDPRAEFRKALAKADKLETREARDKTIAALAWEALELDPEFARETFGMVSPESQERIPLIQHFAMRMADENPDAALEWAGTLGSEREIEAARAQIALVIADADPARAANLLSESAMESRELDVAIVQVLQHWANQKPSDAAAWVVLFPAGEFRKAGVQTVVSQWAESDPSAAFAWVAGLGDEGIRDEATRAMTDAFLQQAPEIRESWLRHADPRTREKLQQAR
jgi:hypothetical protein